MTLFQAFTFAFSSAATAGFSIFADSAGGLNPLTQWIIVIFMMIAGVNYALYEQVSRGKFKNYFMTRNLGGIWLFKSLQPHS